MARSLESRLVDRSGCRARYHGTESATRWAKCICPDAKADRARRVKLRRSGVDLRGRVPAVGSMRRLRALAVLGWPVSELAARVGMRVEQVSRIRRGGYGWSVLASTARKVTACYDGLSMVPGPSTLTGLRARRVGWVPPLAWEGVDMDDPAAVPDMGDEGLPATSCDWVVVELVIAGEPVPRRCTDAEAAEVARRLRAKGMDVTLIAARLRSSTRRVRALLAEVEAA